ncbi:methyl-accepting chemotaxis protein [Curvibacter sp. CHRR-16]|uniref:methyl-accepting chemotaxis protein n=1 Tax=Curvibacter sp. CHRR-16 TaxID=2835872 RepID=UPI0024DF4FC7|nr:methyl-accepting chemotaxis protein [Curvibacter sp. CHRR-16]
MLQVTTWNLRSKLIGAFALLIAILLGLGGASLWAMRVLDSNTDDIAGSSLPAVDAIQEMRFTLNRFRRLQFNYWIVYESDEKKRESTRKNFDKWVGIFDKQVSEYASLLRSPQERALYEELKSKVAPFYASQAKVIALIEKGPDARQEAYTYTFGEAGDMATAIQNTMDALLKLNKQMAADSYESSQAVYKRAWITVLLIILVGVALAMALTWLILRSVFAQLGGEPAVATQEVAYVAQGRLDHPVALQSQEPDSLLAQLGHMKQELTRIVRTVRVAGESVASASSEIAQGNQDLSSRTEAQASSLQQTASTMEEFSASVRENAEHARRANQLAQVASSEVERSGETVQEVVQTMSGISESSRRIADIISVIDGIAFQTNILALNAAVEAARAGEQGRGFAVVATEVRSLAGRSAEAAKEIRGLISASVERVDKGVDLVNKAGQSMQGVVRSIREVTDIIRHITHATDEQSTGVVAISEAVAQIDRSTQANAALVEEMSAAAQSLSKQAEQMVHAMDFFKLGHGGADYASPHPATPLLLA